MYCHKAKLNLKPVQMDWRTNSASLLTTVFLPFQWLI
jgi:hypothetical protein